YAEGERHIRVTLSDNGENVRTEVYNTGSGIPEESLDRIWEKFYKVDKARTREVGGSGIGLSIVKAIMDALNKPCGVINYDDGVGFWFELERAN
ncbi:MAG: ATP-binding protein, partial [Lachnospiraceae bacterium]|nr:ATP-binding protein [Lachnospiraceae bacterium]